MAPVAQTQRKSLLAAKSLEKYPAVEALRKELQERQWLPREVGRPTTTFWQGVGSTFTALLTSADAGNYKTFVNTLFYPITTKYEHTFARMRRNIELSDISLVPETYIGISLMASIGVALIVPILAAIVMSLFNIGTAGIILVLAAAPPLLGFGSFALFYIYPEQSVNRKQYSIDTNLPFAITHMAAVASSGIPPENIFRLLVKFSDYGGVSIEAQNIIRRVDSFGEDLTTAVHAVAQQTPSKDFKEMLYGILSIIESGGNLKEYLKEAARISMFNYELIRKKYTETLATFADIYTALLIAAPLFLVSILVVINIIPDSQVGGFPIDFILKLCTYVIIPGLNILFLLVLTFTQPEV